MKHLASLTVCSCHNGWPRWSPRSVRSRYKMGMIITVTTLSSSFPSPPNFQEHLFQVIMSSSPVSSDEVADEGQGYTDAGKEPPPPLVPPSWVLLRPVVGKLKRSTLCSRLTLLGNGQILLPLPLSLGMVRLPTR